MSVQVEDVKNPMAKRLTMGFIFGSCVTVDNRCLRKLDNYPEDICPLAIMRLKALRDNPDISHADEDTLPGCTWAVNDGHTFCFFKMMKDRDNDESFDTIEIAKRLGITQAAVYSAYNRGVDKIKNSGLGD